MDLFSVISFLFLYYVRPHEWITLFKGLPTFKVIIIMALISLFHKHRGLGWKDVVKTPHDWMMLLYFLWMFGTSPTPLSTFKLVYNLFVFYVVTVITLDTVPRIQKFLNWWMVLILVLTALAVASQYGFDPTESFDLTMGPMKGRLAFNTSIFNNPNALGHSVVPVVVMLYFAGIWKRPVFIRIVGMALMALPLSCLWLTVSKGAFLTGSATILVAFTFRRPLGVQLIIIFLALTFGVVAVQQLPRMQEISSSKKDVAIQGRVDAFRFGLDMMRERVKGVGWANGENELYRQRHFYKAPHSSYVRVGGELGWPGLFLFMSIMYCSARTLLFSSTETVEEERVRRILFVMLVSYAVSSWMVGWADRVTFFMMIAAIGAFHRHLYKQHLSPETKSEPDMPLVTIFNPGKLQPALSYSGNTPNLFQPQPAPLAPVAAPTTEILVTNRPANYVISAISGIKWNRLGWIDLILMFLLTETTIWFWEYIIKKM